jgi:hypothetical protein
MAEELPIIPCPSCGLSIRIPRPRARHDVAVFNCHCGKRWLAYIVGVLDGHDGSGRLMTWDLARHLAEVG